MYNPSSELEACPEDKAGVFLNMPTLYVHSTSIQINTSGTVSYNLDVTGLARQQEPGSRAASKEQYSHSY